jgi:transposase-like protein
MPRIRASACGKIRSVSEAEPFWTKFLHSLTRRGLRGVKLVISDAHEGLKAAAANVLSATWQRCRVRFMRNALAQRQIVERLNGEIKRRTDVVATIPNEAAIVRRGRRPAPGAE